MIKYQPRNITIVPWLFAVLLLITALAPMQAFAGLKRNYPYGPGEKFTFDIYWTVVYGGQATVEVLPDTEIKGVQARHFHATARTSEFVDTFYKVRDTIDSWTNMDVSRTLKFHQVQREGSYEKDTIFDMDWQGGKLNLYGLQGFKGTLDLPGDVLDSLSILYTFRSYPLFIDRRIGGLVTDGKKIVTGEGHVVSRETIDTDLGEFECFKVVPDTKDLGGVFKKSKDATITMWFTADERRIPVRIRSQVSVGHFSLDLIKVEGVEGFTGGE